MTREEAIKELRSFIGHLTEGCQEAIKVLFPELKESEDEKIRQGMIRFLNSEKAEGIFTYEARQSWIAYLEKQKINTEGDFGRGYDCGYKACLNSHGAEFFEKQKEQKEIPMPNSTELIEMWDKEEAMLKEKDFRGDEWRLAYNAFLDGFARGTCVKSEEQKEQKPVEWSEEDEHRRNDAIYFLETAKKHYADTSELEKCIEWLKGLQPTEGIKGNLEEIPLNVDLKKAAGDYIVQLNVEDLEGGFNAAFNAFKAGAEWQKKQFSDILDKWEEHAIRGMKVGASAYHQGKIALICDLQDWIKEQTKK